MSLHSSLTGTDLHEPKGVASASASTVYVASGSGSGTWQKITPASLNTSSIFNTNLWMPTLTYKNIIVANSLMLSIPRPMTLTSVSGVMNGALATANNVMTFNKKGGFTIGTMTFLFSGSAKGDTYILTPSVNNTFIANDWIEVVTGATGTNTVDVTLTLTFTITA